MDLDDHNLRMLDLLQQDARMSVAEISRRIGLAESTVRERLEALLSRGVIRGFRADVDAAKIGHGAHVLVRAKCDLRRLDDVTEALLGIGAVARAIVTTGAHSLEIELRGRDLAEIERVIAKRLDPLDIGPLEMHVVSRELVALRAPHVEDETVVHEDERELLSR